MEIEETFYSVALPVNALAMLARMEAILHEHGTNNPSTLPPLAKIAFRKVLYLLRNATPGEYPGMDAYSDILEDECKLCAHYSSMTLAGHEGWCNARGTRPGMQDGKWKCFKPRTFQCAECGEWFPIWDRDDYCPTCARKIALIGEIQELEGIR